MTNAQNATDAVNELLDGSGAAAPVIVVGIDGSASSVDALRVAARLAERLQCQLHAVTSWTHLAHAVIPVTWFPEEDATATARAAACAVFGLTPPAWFQSSIREGSPAQVLIDASADAEMLVVGSRGRGGFAGLLLGSVSAQCAEHAACPVLVVRHSPPTAEPAPHDHVAAAR